ncbi:MAG TPA: hypothetical protein VLC09_12340 [Polyangiaceae bacterium]|nr:hypothetical protein [Polyangiaceae bacterium]
MRGWRLHRLCAAAWLASCLAAVVASAAPPSAATASAVPTTAAPTTAAGPTTVDPRIAQLEALRRGELGGEVVPQSLFEIDLEDEVALQVELERLRRLLEENDRPGRRPAASAPSSVDLGRLPEEQRAAALALWQARLEVDRARYDFLALPLDERSRLLREQAARWESAHPGELEAQRRAQEEEAERSRALAAANSARSEAQRLVDEELLRLLQLTDAVSLVRADLARGREDLVRRRAAVLGWQRKASDARRLGGAEADGTYDALRRALRSARDDLARALDRLDSGRSAVPGLPTNPLLDLPNDVSATAARQRRAALERDIVAARREELSLRELQASELLGEIDVLNRERLSLLGALSQDKRRAITGFRAAGQEQASSEARHLSLILRYHRHVASDWLSRLETDGARAVAWSRVTTALGLVLLFLLVCVWIRKRIGALLGFLDERLTTDQQEGRLANTSRLPPLVRFALRIYRPLYALLTALVGFWLLPEHIRQLVEVQLLAPVLGWLLTGALVVRSVDALAARRAEVLTSPDSDTIGALRLRSLRLVGATIVLFGLMLKLSARLVGSGTIHAWVFSTCWFTAIPIFLLLVRWWRDVIFQRVERSRSKAALPTWILAHRSGLTSFLAAMAGAVLLFVSGTVRAVRTWITSFDLTRRIHAYLYKREIERLGQSHTIDRLAPIDSAARSRFDPEAPAAAWLACPQDALLDDLERAVKTGPGGVSIIVGARGMGKTTLLTKLHERLGDEAQRVSCESPEATLALRSRIAAEGKAAEGKIAEGDTADTSHGPRTRLVLIDDTQVYIEPRIGGFARFDELVHFARAHARDRHWLLSIDAAVWPLLQRARDSRTPFDGVHLLAPWNELQLGTLLDARCATSDPLAPLPPSFDALIDHLPPGADELDRQDALEAKRAGYMRMLWDHVGGNPGMALEAFRASLGRDASGRLFVRSLQVPDLSRLERLPNSSLFVLRAVLQLAPASVELIASATRMSPADVQQDIHFGTAIGLFDEANGLVRVSWTWLRTVTRHLERRHLLVTP